MTKINLSGGVDPVEIGTYTEHKKYRQAVDECCGAKVMGVICSVPGTPAQTGEAAAAAQKLGH